MEIMKGLLYTEEHEWVRLEDNFAYIGIADHAQESLGDIVFIELPEVEDELEQEEVLADIESVKAADEIYMPISGKIIEVNEEVMDDPALLNEEPYENWLVKIELTEKEELKDLMTDKEYEEFIAEEA